jgi:hypothetical protein
MIDPSRETLLTFPEASQVLPGRPHLTTLHRWRLHGVSGIRLECCKIGGKRFTSREALQRFTERTTEASDGPQVKSATPAQRRRRRERVAAELTAAGI